MAKDKNGGVSRGNLGRSGGKQSGGHAASKASASRSERHTGSPVAGRISSSYGKRKDPVTGVKTTHKGIDIAVKVNTPVRATGRGVVVRAGWQDKTNHKVGFGQRVIIDHGHGNTSIVGHLNSVSVKVGDKVKAGAVIGKSGNTGKSTGPHVHYEERKNGAPHRPTFHPEKYMGKPKKKGK